MKKTLLLLFSLISGAGTAIGADLAGISRPRASRPGRGRRLSVRWGYQENVAWKVKLPGPGASSPVVKDERVFVTCFTGKKGPELVAAPVLFGEEKWKHTLGAEATRPAAPRATTRVNSSSTALPPPRQSSRASGFYVNFCRGGVFAFDLEGQELWQRELGTPAMRSAPAQARRFTAICSWSTPPWRPAPFLR